MSEIDAVLFANEAFYQAFSGRDVEAMEQAWAREAPVSCIHPGWGAIFGREEVMASWIAIISSEGSPAISCHDAIARIYGDTAFVVCFERLGGNVLIATNTFVREGQLWKLVHHQAGPTSARPGPETETDSPPVH